MIFTDSEGREYEYVATQLRDGSGNILIRPVKQELKFDVRIDNPETITLVFSPGIEFKQAELIGEAVESLMFYIDNPTKFNKEWLKVKTHKARSMRENN